MREAVQLPGRAGRGRDASVPEVVKRFTVSKDGRTYTFELKATFRFHTGAPVTAQSFADAINRVAQPKLGHRRPTYMREIVGAAAVIDGKATSISGVRVLGRYRLQIRLTKPVGDFTARLTMPFFCPILPNTPIDPDGIDDPPGSGPYYVAERVVNQRIVLKRNPYYRGDRPANVDQVVWTIGETARLLLARRAGPDRLLLLPERPSGTFGGSAEKYGINRPGGQFFVAPALATWFVAFNHDRPAFKGPGRSRSRRRSTTRSTGPSSPSAFGYLAASAPTRCCRLRSRRPASIYPLAGRPATARELARDARGSSRPSSSSTRTTSRPPSPQAQILVFNLKQIGIDVEVKYFDIGALSGKIATPGEPFDLALHGWAGDYADPAGVLRAPARGRQRRRRRQPRRPARQRANRRRRTA